MTNLRTALAGDQLAVGHTDGNLRIWNLEQGTCEVTLRGHRGTISALRFSKDGTTLASGGRDTDIVMWDVPGEAGLYRLQGHSNEVTDLVGSVMAGFQQQAHMRVMRGVLNDKNAATSGNIFL